jgi:hypothetical protein
MLSESATVAPLSPVPVGVCSSFDCDDERGMLRNDRFCFSPSGAAALAPCEDLDPFLVRSSVEGVPREEDRGGGTMALELGVELGWRPASPAQLAQGSIATQLHTSPIYERYNGVQERT